MDDCERRVESRGMCGKHYAAWRRNVGTKPCIIDGCERGHFGRGYCLLHYEHWKANGDPLVVTIIHGDDAARFASYRPERGPDECWPWLGTLTHEGYGVVQMGGRQVKAHRHAYELAHGPLPDDLVIDHLCHTNSPDCYDANDCLHRRCCNPRHLELVTPGENARRARLRDVPKTHCKHGHEFTEANTYQTPSGRSCRTCHRENEQRRRDAAKAKLAA